MKSNIDCKVINLKRLRGFLGFPSVKIIPLVIEKRFHLNKNVS